MSDIHVSVDWPDRSGRSMSFANEPGRRPEDFSAKGEWGEEQWELTLGDDGHPTFTVNGEQFYPAPG